MQTSLPYTADFRKTTRRSWAICLHFTTATKHLGTIILAQFAIISERRPLRFFSCTTQDDRQTSPEQQHTARFRRGAYDGRRKRHGRRTWLTLHPLSSPFIVRMFKHRWPKGLIRERQRT
jgi:hypothetical protein